MKELQVGQKVWSIQLGDCVVVDNNVDELFPIMCKSLISDNSSFYTLDGKFSYDSEDYYPSLFDSNPFERSVDTNETIEPKLVRQQNDGWVENKAELIKILYSIYMESKEIELREIAKDKLQKVLESI